MRALIVTSSVTFVPENYNRLVCGLAQQPEVVGLIELDNREPSILLKAFGMISTLSAPRMGLTLAENYLGRSRKIRQQVYESQNKFYRVIKSINSTEALRIVEENKIDLILNARTRSIFKADILKAPRLGCINIHHGLLPQQRGLMCDFWAHMENEPYGFSIHQMTSKIDDGPLLHVQKVDSDRKCYMQSVLKASETEAEACKTLLRKIKEENRITPLKIPVSNFKYRKNPALTDGYKLQIRGIRI